MTSREHAELVQQASEFKRLLDEAIANAEAVARLLDTLLAQAGGEVQRPSSYKRYGSFGDCADVSFLSTHTRTLQ